MKTLFLTDTHIGARNGSKIFRDLFRQYYKEVLFPYIKENNVHEVIHLGDFFDNRNSLSLHDIDYITNEFIPQFEETGAIMRVIAGNHDVAYKNTNKINSLSLLKSDMIKIIDDHIEIVEIHGHDSHYKLVLCPWLNTENSERLLDEIKLNATDISMLCGHFEFQNFKMYKHSGLCEHGLDHNIFKNYLKVLSGHFHHASFQGNVEYIGALFHYNWADLDDYRGFLLFDPDEGTFERIENPYCLFTQLDYYQAVILDKEELETACKEQFVRIIINDEYNKLDLKELLYKIEKFYPLSVDVIDNTIVNSSVVDKQKDSATVKSISDYASEYITDSSVLKLFEEIKAKAEQKIVEII